MAEKEIEVQQPKGGIPPEALVLGFSEALANRLIGGVVRQIIRDLKK